MGSSDFDHQYFALLAQRIRAKDNEAFAELYHYTYKKLYRYSYYFLQDAHLAQDALQEIYISMYKNISSLKSDQLLLSWMKHITYHVCCDFKRKIKSSHNAVTDFTEDSVLVNLISENDCFQEIYDKDFLEYLETHLEHLPIHLRQAFILRYKNELKLEQISDFMNCSLSSVKRYIKSAKKELQKKFKEYIA